MRLVHFYAAEQPRSGFCARKAAWAARLGRDAPMWAKEMSFMSVSTHPAKASLCQD